MKTVLGGSKTTDYCGNVIYENGLLKRILVDGGYIENSTYYFYLTDHLGNNRVIASSSGSIVQSNHYYPFGMSFAEGSTTSQQPYKYNGKELDTERGLNLYDYSARYMDPALGRFSTVDPMAEKYYSWSPYVYVGNDPVNLFDPDGMDWYQSNEDENRYIWREGHKDIEGYKNVGSSMSIQTGKDSYLNFYQNAGVKSNKAVNAFGLIASSGKLQNILLGDNSPLSENSKSELFNGLINRERSEIERQIGRTLVGIAAGELAGPLAGRALAFSGAWLKALFKGTAKGGGKELFNFSAKAAEHMTNPGRAVPVQILEQAIKGSRGVADPRGSRALMHTIEMWKNGKAYNLEVLYDKTTNYIWHFKYSPIKP
ncbi:hypothetical protein JCM15093_3440 [Bacteroides graminisolvens DSM 19988 = JCM 15093]|uniref:RHS repeat-associated core domain-containing protein n=1 Tax=Bacteroides graminisolvens DSM 19988 = JCM 15093 TaxID=1121097 RepID=A0A069D749_9BACE|nr:hypothetical protein JCM15093_3440 [Bacteroides graminisolvens DSM 19988 = JCM 15093]